VTDNLSALAVIGLSVAASAVLALVGIYKGAGGQLTSAPAAIWTIVCFVPLVVGALHLSGTGPQTAQDQSGPTATTAPAAG